MLKTQANSKSLLVIKEAVLNLRYFSRTYITLVLVAFFSTSLASDPSESCETPSIKQAQEKLMQQIKNVDFFINYQPTLLLEKVYGWLSDTTPFNGVNSILLWVIILTITPYLHKPNALMLLMLIISPCTRYIAQYIDASSQLHAYKSHLALAASLQQLKLAEQALSASCSITLKKAQCSSQDKEALLTAGPPHSMLGNTLFRANSLAQFFGFRSFRNLLIALPLLYAATTSPQEILRRGPSYIPSALLKCLLSSTVSMVISYSFMYLIQKLDNYDNGAISLAQAHRQLANSQISFQTALNEIAKFNKAPEKP